MIIPSISTRLLAHTMKGSVPRPRSVHYVSYTLQDAGTHMNQLTLFERSGMGRNGDMYVGCMKSFYPDVEHFTRRIEE